MFTATAADGSGVKAECRVTVKYREWDFGNGGGEGIGPQTFSLILEMVSGAGTNGSSGGSGFIELLRRIPIIGWIINLLFPQSSESNSGGDGSSTVTGVTVKPKEAFIIVGGTKQLRATVTPSNAIGVIWTSSDESIATVSKSGLVTGVKKGTVTITATSVDKNDTCKVTVKTPYTSTQEKEENKRQKEAVAKIIAKSKYAATDTAWNKGTGIARENNRKDLLTQLLAELQKEMGTSAVTTIQWYKDSDNVGGSGRYSPTAGNRLGNTTRTWAANTIYINVDRFDLHPRILRYVAHELRHCYQYEAVDDPGKHIVTSATIEKWGDKSLNSAGGSYPDVSHMRQPIEWDAYYFTDQIGKDDFVSDYKGNWY